MHDRAKKWLPTLVGTGLLLGLAGPGCSDSGSKDDALDQIRSAKSALQRAQDCADLLSMLKADAVAKLEMEGEKLIAQYNPDDYGRGDGDSAGGPDWGVGDPGEGPLPVLPPTSSPQPGAPTDDASGGDLNAGGNADGDSASGDGDSGGSGNGGVAGPTGSSNTNTQVEDVDEADFVKVVKQGESMFVLHGNGLFKLDTWPADLTSLKSDIEIEGSPTEMFVTDAGKAVVFSNVSGYGGPRASIFGDGGKYPAADFDAPCASVDSAFGGISGGCGGYYGSDTVKITVVDVSSEEFETERELYFKGSYTSSRRYADVVRAVFQSSRTIGYSGLGGVEPWDYSDPQKPHVLSKAEYKRQVRKLIKQQQAKIDGSKLEDWLPELWEAKDGKIAKVAPACDNYYVPAQGVSGEGLTHILTLDLEKGGAPGGVTIMGSAQTVYSNKEHLVLAQPDYRWDFGFVGEQRTNLYLFDIDKADTYYAAAGSVTGSLPPHNAQFGMDMQGDVLRLATTGRVRKNPDASMEDQDFWDTTTDNRVFTLKQKERELTVIGQTDYLGKVNETVQSARFVGDRGYVVTFQQIDPLIVLDLKDPSKIETLGEIEIPGFSQYMHPLDDTHLITIGTNANWGVQLQLFDVSKFPLAQPKVIDFGDASSEGQYNHKALTFYREQGVLALPLTRYGSTNFSSTLQLIKVDVASGFDWLGEVDHSSLYSSQSNGCVQCSAGSCYYSCSSYAPDVRRGHFVSGEDDATYVYSFSYAGVVVTDLADLTQNVASVLLPAPEWSSESWYGSQIPVPSNPSGGSGTDTNVPNAGEGKPEPVSDAGVDVPVDGGAAPDQDGGSATPQG